MIKASRMLSIFDDRLKNQEGFIGILLDDKEDVYLVLKEFFGKRCVEA